MQHLRKKMTRKELKEDKFIIITLKAKEFFEKNTKLVTRSIFGLIIIAAIMVYFVHSKKAANRNAATMLGRVELILAKGEQNAAMDSLQNIVNRFDGTESAGKSTFLLAKLYWERNDFQNAKIYFKKYIDEYMNKTVVSQSALAGYADCLIKESNYEEAAKYYERAAEVNADYPETPEFLFSAAAAYKDAGKFEKAEELVKKLIDNFNNAQVKNKAEVLLEDLKYEKS